MRTLRRHNFITAYAIDRFICVYKNEFQAALNRLDVHLHFTLLICVRTNTVHWLQCRCIQVATTCTFVTRLSISCNANTTIDGWMNGRVQRMKRENREQRVQGRKRNCIDSRFKVCVFFLSLRNALYNRLHFISHSRPHIRTRSEAISIHFILILSFFLSRQKKGSRREKKSLGSFVRSTLQA